MAKECCPTDKYTAKAHEAGVKIRQVIDATTGEVSDVAETVEARIEQKPVQSTLIALGAGLILGLLLRRR